MEPDSMVKYSMMSLASALLVQVVAAVSQVPPQ